MKKKPMIFKAFVAESGHFPHALLLVLSYHIEFALSYTQLLQSTPRYPT